MLELVTPSRTYYIQVCVCVCVCVCVGVSASLCFAMLHH